MVSVVKLISDRLVKAAVSVGQNVGKISYRCVTIFFDVIGQEEFLHLPRDYNLNSGDGSTGWYTGICS